MAIDAPFARIDLRTEFRAIDRVNIRNLPFLIAVGLRLQIANLRLRHQHHRKN
jgi:hypothetical protein